MKSISLYLDVDVVLLGKDDPRGREIVLPRHVKEFLEYCLKHFECYWLSTHCKDGDRSQVVRWMSPYADQS